MVATENSRPKALIARNTLYNFLGQVLPLLVGVVTIPYIVRGLGDNGYGILSIAFAIVGYFGIFDLGLSRATVKFVAEHASPDLVHKVPELVWTSLTLLFALGCLGGGMGAAFVPVLVTHFLKMPPSFAGPARSSLFILCAAMPVMFMNDALRGVLEAAQRFDLINYVKVPASSLFYLLCAVGVFFGFRVPGLVMGLVLLRFCTSWVYLILCLHVFPGLRKGFRFSPSAVRPLASFGGWVMVSNITGPLFGNLERFLIGAVLSVGMLTYYSVPFDLLSKVLIFPGSIAPALFPYFSAHGSKGSIAVTQMTSRSLKYLMLVMTPMTAAFVFFAHDILKLWMGSQFADRSTSVMQILAFVFLLNAFSYIPYSSVQALGRPDLKAILDLVALPVYAVSCWWFMRVMGLNGAALAKLLVTGFDVVFLFGFAWKMKAFSPRDCVSGPLSRTIFASGCLLAAVFLAGCLHLTLPGELALVGASTACYLVAFWFTAVDEDDRHTLRALSLHLRAKNSAL